MNPTSLTLTLVCALAPMILAGPLDTIGWTELNNREPGLNGSGLTLAQVEAKTSDIYWQADPADANLAPSLFTYFSEAATYPVNVLDPAYPTKWQFNSSLESGHANGVANNYFDALTGVARAPAAIEVFEASYFFNFIVNLGAPIIDAEIINQSFIFTDLDPTEAQVVINAYDNYAINHQKLFVSGVNNSSSSQPPPPATMYNGIAVGRVDGGGSTGPTTDGRSKPDIVAPATTTSAATPFVAGSAALLRQAATRGDGGSGTEVAAADIRTLKALLLNGAVKPAAWSRVNNEPLSRNKGAGILNVNRAHLQLSGGQHAPTATGEVAAGSATTPATTSNRVSSLRGWNRATISTRQQGPFNTYDGVHDYHFAVNTGTYHDLTATTTWLRQANRAAINNLQLKLFSYPDNTLIASSTSSVDNVEHLHVQDLTAGDYVIQVVSLRSGSVSNSETYALAFDFEEVTPPTGPNNLTVSPVSDTSLTLTWTDTDLFEEGYRILRLNSSSGLYEQIATVGHSVTQYTNNGLAAGTTYSYKVQAYNLAGENTTVAVAATTYSALQQWRLTHFGSPTNSGDGANQNDFDLDGLANLLEYALGTDPTSGVDGPLALPLGTLEDQDGTRYLTLTVSRSDIEPGISYEVNVSGDLSSWTNDVTVLNDTPTELKVRDNTPSSSANKRFIRLIVSEP